MDIEVERPGPVEGQDPRIVELWAWTAVDPMTDTEGIVAMRTAGGGGLPLVTPTRELAERLRPLAEATARAAAEPRPVLQLRRFVPAGRPANCNCSGWPAQHDELCPARTNPRDTA